jgi:hypothetical protein
MAEPEATMERVYYDHVGPGGTLTGTRILQPITRASLAPGAGAKATWDVTTILNNGPPQNRLDLVILGDGFRAPELPLYTQRAQNVLSGLMLIEPFARYKSYFNVHRVDVISNDSGIDISPSCGTLDTALDMSLGCERDGLYVDVGGALAAATAAPGFDQVLALGNTDIGAGVGFYSANVAAMGGDYPPLAAHELGHSLGDLGDEYFDPAAVYMGGEAPEANISILNATEMAALGTKWARWLGTSDPLFDSPVGTYEGAWYHGIGIYRPSLESMMRYLSRPFNLPSVEQLIFQIYRAARPIDGGTPSTELLDRFSTVFITPLRPAGLPLAIQWSLDGQPIPGATQETFDATAFTLPDGDHNLSVEVKDTTPWVRDEAMRSALMTFGHSWPIEIGNRSPRLALPAEVRIDEGTPVEFQVSATDPDGTPIASLTATGPPLAAGATFTVDASGAVGTFRWTPGYAAAGIHQVDFTATNDKSRTAPTVFFVQNVNRAPSVAAPASAAGDEGALVSVVVSADDPDGEAVSLTAAPLPANASFADLGGGDGSLVWYPEYDQSGDYPVTFTGRDALGLSSATTTTITIRNVDRAPAVTAPFNRSVGEGQALSFLVTASDPDGEPITALNAAPLPAGAVFKPDASHTSGTFDWTPDFTQSGLHPVTFSASNALQGSIVTNITVTNAVRPPVVVAPASASGREGSLLEFAAGASDPDGQGIDSLLASGLPPGASFSTNAAMTEGAFSWTPNYDQAGSYAVMISAKSACRADGVSGPVSQECEVGTALVDVQVANTDRAPAIATPATVTVGEGDVLAFTVGALDPDGEPVATLAATDLPFGATFVASSDASQGAFAWTPTFAQAGSYSVRFTATNALTGDAVTEIVVQERNRSPVSAPGGPYAGVAGVAVSFDGSASMDPDGEALTHEWWFGDGGSASGPAPDHIYSAGGAFVVSLTVRDAGNPPLSSTGATTATIAAEFQAEAFVDRSNQTIRLGSGKPLWCVRLEPRGGNFLVEELSPSEFALEYAGGVAPAIPDKSGAIGDQDKNGTQELEVCFGKEALRLLFASLPPGRRTVSVSATGPLTGGARVRGEASVDVVSNGGGIASALTPNPLLTEGVLTFSTTQPGAVRVGVYDLQGRRVRSLLDVAGLPAGYHDVRISRERLGIPRLVSGVYFYRIEAPEGVAVGKLTLLR